MNIEVGPRKQEKHIPEYNAVEKFNNLLYRFGKVTTAAKIGGGGNGRQAEHHVTRPLSLRNTRAELYREIRQTIKTGDEIDASGKSDKRAKAILKEAITERKKDLFAQAHDRDAIALQYLNQGEIKIELQGLGEQSARYTRIDPPASRIKPEDADKPPIFLIPGISHDIDCVGALVQEIAFNGRSVVVVGFPESYMGSVTDEFAQAVKDTPTYGPHTDFYKKALNALLPPDSELEIWGYSTGAAITAEILNDEKFQQRTSNAVLLAPASSTDITSCKLYLGAIKDTVGLLKKFSSLGKYSYNSGRNKDGEPHSPKQKALRENVFGSLLQKVRTKSDAWNGAQVQTAGNIVVVSGGKDDMTKSYQVEDTFRQNPQMRVLHLHDGFHATSLIEPVRVLQQVFATQD